MPLNRNLNLLEFTQLEQTIDSIRNYKNKHCLPVFRNLSRCQISQSNGLVGEHITIVYSDDWYFIKYLWIVVILKRISPKVIFSDIGRHVWLRHVIRIYLSNEGGALVCVMTFFHTMSLWVDIACSVQYCSFPAKQNPLDRERLWMRHYWKIVSAVLLGIWHIYFFL